MNTKRLLGRAAAVLVLTVVAVEGIGSLSSDVQAKTCKEPFVCPAIGIFCLPGPNGQERKPCRLQPCSCKVTCVPASHPCAN